MQMDGSHHAWFEDRGAQCCFMNMVDDATGNTFNDILRISHCKLDIGYCKLNDILRISHCKSGY